jgi:membrane-associated phospholipid phosphatase
LVILAELYGPVMLVTSPLVLVVGWSRVRLHDHTPTQVVAGAVIGALVTGITFAAMR